MPSLGHGAGEGLRQIGFRSVRECNNRSHQFRVNLNVVSSGSKELESSAFAKRATLPTVTHD